MNREAVALGTPVWTTFEGRLGAVDERLIAEGRLRRLDARRGRRARSAARRRAPTRVRRDPAVFTDLFVKAVRRGSRAANAQYNAADAPPDPYRGLPDPSPALRRWRWTRGWSRWLITSPTAAVRRGHPAALLRTCSGARSRSRSSASLVCFALVGMYRHWMRYSSQREYCKIAEGVRARRAGAVGYVAVVQPKLDLHRRRGFVSLTVPAGVLVLFGLLMGVVPHRHALPRAHHLRARRCAAAAPRRNARSVLIVGAGDGGRLLLRELLRNPELGYRPGRLRRRRPAQAGRAHRPRLEVLGTTVELAEVLEDVEPDEVLIAIPSAPGELRARVVQRLPRARRAGAHDADRLRAAADRRPPDAPAARGARRGRAGPRAGADGDRARRRLPDRPLRAGHRRGRVDRLGAVPPDRARGPEPARPARPRRGRTCSRSSASWSRTATSSTRSRCWPTARTRSACARCSPSTARRSSSTPPPTSTSALMEANPVEAVRNNALATRDADARRRRGRARARSCSSRPTRRSRPATVMGASKALAEWAVEAADARYPRTRRSAPCASATCSAPRARWCRSSAARSPPAAR